jgi:2-haloacid dehalogenase
MCPLQARCRSLAPAARDEYRFRGVWSGRCGSTVVVAPPETGPEVRELSWWLGYGFLGMELEDFAALSFDCYGTLIDWEAGIAEVLEPWARAHRLDLDAEELLVAYSVHEAREELEHPAAPYPEIMARSMQAMGRELGVDVTREEAARLGASVPEWPAFEDSPAALQALAGRYQLLILSNVDRASFAASARRLGVEFAAVVTAEDVGAYKPSDRSFEALHAMRERLGIPRDGLLHVAQSLFHDHLPAQRAGLPTVWIDRRYLKPGWGATPPPPEQVRPGWTFPSMAAFAEAALQ